MGHGDGAKTSPKLPDFEFEQLKKQYFFLLSVTGFLQESH
jgi:hypothetical protein